MFTLPLQQLRVGLFFSDRLSIEPSAGLRYASTNEGLARYSVGLGVLYHFSSDTAKATFYVRPLIETVGARGGGDTERATSLGVGVGVKTPIASRLVFRMETNYARQRRTRYGTPVQVLGVTFGLSLFSR